jgi:hypothetical protein
MRFDTVAKTIYDTVSQDDDQQNEQEQHTLVSVSEYSGPSTFSHRGSRPRLPSHGPGLVVDLIAQHQHQDAHACQRRTILRSSTSLLKDNGFRCDVPADV